MLDGYHFHVTTQGAGKCWRASTVFVDCEREAMRIHSDPLLQFLLPVYVWSVRPLTIDGLMRRTRILGQWEFPSMDQEYGPSVCQQTSNPEAAS